MPGNVSTLADSGNRPRVFYAAATGISALLAAVLVFGAFGGAVPVLARVEATVPVAADGKNTAQVSAHRLCFYGPQGDLLHLVPAGQPCS